MAEFTENERDFLIQCVKMAAREGYYLLAKDCDVEKVGIAALEKIGVDREKALETINEF
ncbi:MAG: hypothetical protein NC548_22340 [Lachnospiraceae bacterium]|nr:hypothetical protein [Lachnospiraceae bacterium]